MTPLTAEELEGEVVTDPDYGVVLYYYYQQEYFDALTEMLIAEKRGGLQHEGQNPELLKGGISLSYGLDKQAESIFTRLLDGAVDPVVRDRAWFYLGKLFYQRKAYAEAEQSLAKVTSSLEPQLSQEKKYFSALLALNKNDNDVVETELAHLPGDSIWRAYIRYNQGVFLNSRLQSLEAYKAWESVVANLSNATDEEAYALRDRTNVALGYSYLTQNYHDQAINAFTRVRLQGVDSESALLGYGWAQANKNDYHAALSIWKELLARPHMSIYAQEALVAVPYAYEKLQAYSQALNYFEIAAKRFELEIARLDRVVAQLDEKDFFAELIQAQNWSDSVWLSRKQELNITPNDLNLVELMSGDDYQTYLKDARDLQVLRFKLQQWQDRVKDLQVILATKQQARQERLARMNATDIEQSIGNMQQARDGLQQKIIQAEKNRQGIILAEQQTKEYQNILQSAYVRAVRLQQAGQNVTDELARLDRIKGLLLWQLDYDFDEKLWQAKNELQLLDKQLALANARKTSLLAAMVVEPDYQKQIQQVATLAEKVTAKQQQASALQDNVKKQLQGLTRKALLQQKQRLQQYYAQAKLSVVRLYDLSLEQADAVGGGE